MNSGRHARLLSLLFLMTSSINCMNPCRTAWMQLMEAHEPFLKPIDKLKVRLLAFVSMKWISDNTFVRDCIYDRCLSHTHSHTHTHTHTHTAQLLFRDSLTVINYSPGSIAFNLLGFAFHRSPQPGVQESQFYRHTWHDNIDSKISCFQTAK